uniref:MACPF domain-containing protein n=1 Tax=Felis catus TaxID=9685 RepID=A0ABI8A6C1_FELCA
MLCSLPPSASPSCLLPPATPGPLINTCSINSNRTVFRHVYTALNAPAEAPCADFSWTSEPQLKLHHVETMKISVPWAQRTPSELILLSAALGCLSLPGSRGERPQSLESNAVNESLAKSRHTRNVDVSLMPIDCELSSWSAWTTCDPCQKKRHKPGRLSMSQPASQHSSLRVCYALALSGHHHSLQGHWLQGYQNLSTGILRCLSPIISTPLSPILSLVPGAGLLTIFFADLIPVLPVSAFQDKRPSGVPCKGAWYRHAYLLRPSQFNGEPCNFSDKEVEDCVTSRPCRSQVQCEGFVCAQTGRCVNRRLLCNGDNDCGDQSDEANCRRIYKKCQHEMDQYWAIGRLASGINLFTNSFEGPVLDHRYYAGGCSPHYILNTRFRKPYNVETYTPQTQGKYEFVLTEYESYSDFERSITEREKSMSSSGFGVKIPGIFEIGISSASANGKHFIRRIKRFSHTKSTFLHARSDLEVARYKLKPRSLMLHYELLQRVKLLPLEYSYGEYRDLFRDFGTHYITEAVLGGIYEYTLIMNKEAMERADYSLKDVQACAKNDFKIGAAFEEVYVSLGVSVGTCQGILREIKDRNKRDTMVDDLVVLVRGGASEHITALAYKELPTADLMQEWGDAVQYNPDIIKIKAEPLYELVTATDFAYSSTVRQNMKRALEEFQKEVSSCHCAPCQGNGVPVLKESRCECICPVGFQGPACEVTYEKRTIRNGAPVLSQATAPARIATAHSRNDVFHSHGQPVFVCQQEGLPPTLERPDCL